MRQGVRVQTAAGIGQQNATSLPLKQRHVQRQLQGVDALADGGLGQPEGMSGGRETAQLGGPSEGFQMWELVVGS